MSMTRVKKEYAGVWALGNPGLSLKNHSIKTAILYSNTQKLVKNSLFKLIGPLPRFKACGFSASPFYGGNPRNAPM
jgi:hypothetical protein